MVYSWRLPASLEQDYRLLTSLNYSGIYYNGLPSRPKALFSVVMFKHAKLDPAKIVSPTSNARRHASYSPRWYNLYFDATLTCISASKRALQYDLYGINHVQLS